MPELSLQDAQALIGRVVENPDAPASQAIADRQLIEALATVIVRYGLLAGLSNG